MIGRALNGRYELVGILGVGGMATVWRGVDRVLGRQVAVKVLNGGLADDPRFAERFSREAQHAAMLVHPRIVMVFDSGVDQGTPFIVMELVTGRSLAALLAEQQVLPVERAVGIAAAVCEALSVAHAAGLVHRDIKPGNIMITDDGGVKVVDFGIARAGSSSNLTQTASVLGTAAYLSPEQATASALDGRTDLYAVGCVLTEMLTGATPFTAETPVAIAFKHVSEQPLPPSVRRPGLPPALDGAVLRLLAKNPADRPADAAAARAELLGTVPGLMVGDPTAELLANTAGAATQLLPPVPFSPPSNQPYQPNQLSQPNQLGQPDQQHTTLLPPQPPAATSVMAPIPGPVPAPMRAPAPAPAARPASARGRRKPLVLGALGVAGLAGVTALALTAFDEPAGNAAAAKPAAATAPTTPAGSAATPTQKASPTATSAAPTTPSAPPSAPPAPTQAVPRNQPAALQIQAFRQAVAQAQVGKERDKQAELLRILDTTAARLNEGNPDDAAQELKDAQKVIRDMGKKHAVDVPTYANWNARLSALYATLHTTADFQDD
ncbi:serine/threonine protein kinase [Kitasatospora xanthocidica]|uniref:non-specific serine/threonine protein kinase n=1 Tax=Kitasatospora xanthocidica TaxID=83382 RepID=A0A372ZWZ5_9ACTN|nr:protein kinase [Kitasatospora xanthocidica]RGD60363.1 serine/threonine protein kinase [Kitasatospora xanthocidica]